MKRTCLVALLLLGGGAAAQDVNKPTSPAAGEARSIFYDGTHFGLQVDAGLPAGATAAVVFRPWSFLRLNAGIAHDALAFGYQGGVTLIPFHWGVTPTLSFEAGHFGDGDINSIVTISDPTLKLLTRQIGYDYVSADVGLEFGSQNRFVFYVRGGITKVSASVHNLQAAIQTTNPGLRVTAAEPDASAVIPAARLGFIFYMF